VKVHLVDGTYELFRHFFAVPPAQDAQGHEIAAARGVLGSMIGLLEEGATHLAVATDHVIESFRNDLWAGYKTGAGIDPALRSQFEPLEEWLRAAGIRVFAMVEHEADDALATAAETAAADSRVEQVLICTPDKDLAQCVRGTRVVQLDRRKRALCDEAGVALRFGVGPASIPDYLALVGDSADGFPGLPGFGARSAAVLLARWKHLEAIPDDASKWEVPVRGAARLAATLAGARDEALLFRRLATLIRDVPDLGKVDDWRWTGPTPAFSAVCQRLNAASLLERAQRLSGRRRASTPSPG
jgi:5'-3' exonuclease